MTLHLMMRLASLPHSPSGRSVLANLANLGRLDPREADTVASWPAKRAAVALEVLVDELLEKAFSLWLSRSLIRHSDEEPCCAVVFYGCCLDVLSTQDTLMQIVYEAEQPSREMLAGTKHPKSAARPDMTIIYTSKFAIKIEAKRLLLGETLPRKYVREGMRRFIDGKYSSSHGYAGYMIGFVVRDETTDVLSAINQAILDESDLGASDQLEAINIPHQRLVRCESTHVNDLRLIHSFMDVRLASGHHHASASPTV
jgi:hypothetical protein